MSATSTPNRRKPGFPGSLTDLHRFRKTVHGHDGSSRIVMVRKTDQRTFASIEKGQEPKLETITRETIETFRGPKSACKITTEKKAGNSEVSPEIIESLQEAQNLKLKPKKRINPLMEFQNQCLNAHNEFRKRHNVPPLKLDTKMCKHAQEWADHLINTSSLKHRDSSDYGENIFSMRSSDPNFCISGMEPVESWYSEIKEHTFGVEPDGLGTSHFTQVIWDNSVKLGVGFAKKAGRVVVVANYDPPGNFIGQYRQHVPPIGGFSTNSHLNNNSDDYCDGLAKITLTASKSTKHFEEEFLEAHNDFRKLHGVPPLVLDKKLCKYSEEWARHLAAKNALEHRPTCNYGENIFCVSSSNPNFTINGKTPVENWYDEMQFHLFGREPNDLKTGHFTQVVWKSSKQLGVGVAKNKGKIYVVANYSPAGNFVGDYVENVLAPISAKKNLLVPSDKDSKKVKFPENAKNGDGFTEFALDGLKVHNEFRKKHGVPELKLNRAMCDYAQEWANICANNASMSHRANNPYGENVYCLYSSDLTHIPTAKEAIKLWYDEIKQFTFGSESVNRDCLHFTQVIWKSSTELGLAIAKNAKGESYVVANYSPKGNYIGQFVENVPRMKF